MLLTNIRYFIRHEAAGGFCLMGAALLALIAANISVLSGFYTALVTPAVTVLVNDGLMTLFFLLVGLELKREIIAGELSSRQRLLQPLLAALGGMIVPCLIFMLVNRNNPEHWRGWAVPAATDIAFALGILNLLGQAIAKRIRILLTAIAILDDLGAILVIALFYSASLHFIWLSVAVAAIIGLVLLNRSAVNRIWPYLLCGLVVWVGFFKGGIHPTLAGVITAFAIPLRDKSGATTRHGLLYRLEHKLHYPVAFIVLPVFAFTNAGLSLHGLGIAVFQNTLTMGVLLGLLLGKPLGIMGGLIVGHGMGWAPVPKDIWRSYLTMACLCAIGFTMALFIGDLAFADPSLRDQVKVGIFASSLTAAFTAWVCCRFIKFT